MMQDAGVLLHQRDVSGSNNREDNGLITELGGSASKSGGLQHCNPWPLKIRRLGCLMHVNWICIVLNDAYIRTRSTIPYMRSELSTSPPTVTFNGPVAQTLKLCIDPKLSRSILTLPPWVLPAQRTRTPRRSITHFVPITGLWAPIER